MEATATVRYLKTGNRKVEIVLDLIRGKRVEEAISILRFSERATAKPVEKLLRSAMANAAQKNTNLDLDVVRVSRCWANIGPVQRNARRFVPRAMGRASKIAKKTCHVTIVLADAANKSKA
jgi:large subunit ribosomal protein L22